MENNIDYIKKTDIVFDEILSNISKYSYKDSPGTIDIYCDYQTDSKTLFFKFIDSGIAFNPLNVAEVDTTVSIEKRQSGGLGIFIVKCIMDDIKYKRYLNKNILTLKKFLV